MPPNHRSIALAIVTALATTELAYAQPVATEASPLDISLQLHGGATTAPFTATELPRVNGHGIALLFAARVRVQPLLYVGARVPLALINVGQPAGSYVAEAAWGNPELLVEREFSFEAGARSVFARARLAVGVPLAEHGSAGLMENRALAVADALFAWRERELFVPGVVPVTPAGELAMPFDRWSAHAMVKLPVLIRVSEVTSTNAIGLTPVLALGAHAAITRKLEASGGVDGAFDLMRPVEWVGDGSRVQLSAHAGLVWRIAGGFRLGATFLLPLGGALGGETLAGGITLAQAP